MLNFTKIEWSHTQSGGAPTTTGPLCASGSFQVVQSGFASVGDGQTTVTTTAGGAGRYFYQVQVQTP